jgi:hypothetical protein
MTTYTNSVHLETHKSTQTKIHKREISQWALPHRSRRDVHASRSSRPSFDDVMSYEMDEWMTILMRSLEGSTRFPCTGRMLNEHLTQQREQEPWSGEKGSRGMEGLLSWRSLAGNKQTSANPRN